MLAKRLVSLGDTPLANHVLTICSQLFGAPEEPLSDVEILAAERELGVVLPPSYRTFLRYYAAGTTHTLEVFGLPRDRLCRDVVLVNKANPRLLSLSLVKIAKDLAGRTYYLDFARVHEDGECPVLGHGVGLDAWFVAENFLQFLTLVEAESIAPVWPRPLQWTEGGYRV